MAITAVVAIIVPGTMGRSVNIFGPAGDHGQSSDFFRSEKPVSTWIVSYQSVSCQKQSNIFSKSHPESQFLTSIEK